MQTFLRVYAFLYQELQHSHCIVKGVLWPTPTLACSRFPDSWENENCCVWNASGGLGRPKPPLIFRTHFFRFPDYLGVWNRLPQPKLFKGKKWWSRVHYVSHWSGEILASDGKFMNSLADVNCSVSIVVREVVKTSVLEEDPPCLRGGVVYKTPPTWWTSWTKIIDLNTGNEALIICLHEACIHRKSAQRGLNLFVSV